MALPIVVGVALAVLDVSSSGCPDDAAIRKELGVEGAAWRVACNATKDGEVEMAALLPPDAPGGAPRIAVSAGYGEHRTRAEVMLDGPKREGLEPFEQKDWAWEVRIGPAGIRGGDWLRVDVTARSGEDLKVAQTVTAFLLKGPGMRLLWNGAGDRHEARFDACRLDTAARFSLSRDGDLVRARRTNRTFVDPGRLDDKTLASAKAECIAKRATRETFPVADDGLSTDVTVEPALRERARANRLLFLRAAESDEDFAQFVADSLALVEPLRDAVASGKPLDPGQELDSIDVPGAFAYALEGGLRAGLDWKNLKAVAKPAGARLINALRAFDGGDYLGAWTEATTDLGGCHKPARATRALGEVVAAWQAAPEVVRDAFVDHLTRRLADMTSEDCFCAPRSKLPKIEADLERNAHLLDGLPEIGPAAATRLQSLATAPDTKFGCIGPH